MKTRTMELVGKTKNPKVTMELIDGKLHYSRNINEATSIWLMSLVMRDLADRINENGAEAVEKIKEAELVPTEPS